MAKNINTRVNSMVTIFMTKGLPGSGKTTWARKYQETLGNNKIVRVNKDDLRAMIDNGQWSKENEKFILEVRDAIINQALRRGRHVVVDDTNLDPKHETALRKLASSYTNVGFKVVPFTHETLDTCLQRNSERCGASRVPEKVIREMWSKYLAPPTPKPPVYDPNLADCIIVDIDGTVAIHGDRSPFDWARVGEDTLNTQVAELVQTYLTELDVEVIFVSGRDEVCRQDTQDWLFDYFEGVHFPETPLFMRPKGDTRDDRIIKKEIYDREVVGKYNVRFVLDDRNKVVEMWRSLGLTCLQVAPGDF